MNNALRHLIALPLLAHAAAFGEPATDLNWSVKLAQGTSKQLSVKPAEIYYLKENDENSSALNAGLIGALGLPPSLSSPGRIDSELTFGGSIAKTNLKSTPQDMRTADVGLRTLWALGDGSASPPGQRRNLALETYLSYSREDDRRKRAKSHKEQFDVSLTGLCRNPDYDVGQSGVKFGCYPYVGVYRRSVTETDDPIVTPTGRHGGPYAGFLLRLAFGKVEDDFNWWAPFSIEADAYHLRESFTSGGYNDNSYKYATLTLSYALYRSEASKWKPRISLVREMGTDRLNNEDHIVSTKLALQVSYGL
jgi:hypothetical protein